MSLTVGKLKEVIKSMRDDAIVSTEQNQDIINIVACDTLILSTTKPIGYCNRSGSNVFPSVVEGYSAFCPKLDEDLYDMEWSKFE